MRNIAGATLAGLLIAAGMGGCRGERSNKPPHQFLPDMDDSPKWKPQSQSEFFADGRTMRPNVPGAVAWGLHAGAPHLHRAWDHDFSRRDSFLKADRAYYFGRDENNDFITVMPASVKVDRALLKRGEERFEIYCSVCHGFQAEGGYPDGTKPVDSSAPVGKRWAFPVPTFHDAKYKDPAQRTGKDGYIFDVIRHGKWQDQVNHTGTQTMPSYARAVNEDDAWAIIAYIRVLQATWTTDLDSLPPDLRPPESERPPAPQPEKTAAMAEEAGR